MTKKRNRSQFVPISEVLPELFKNLGLDGRNREVQDVWREIAGEELSAMTRVAALRAGILTVEVSEAALLHELTIYYKRDFLKTLQQRLRGRVRDLRFKIASPKRKDFLEDRESPPPPYRY